MPINHRKLKAYRDAHGFDGLEYRYEHYCEYRLILINRVDNCYNVPEMTDTGRSGAVWALSIPRRAVWRSNYL